MKQENDNKKQAVQQPVYEAPVLTTVSFKTEKGYAASGKGGVTDYFNNPSEDW
ncbi:MAG: hypothetical protein IJR04_03785 [Bacteroidales bacterium]|nr:hypothetical protein [Bacteroidales bacterium]